MGLPVLRDVVEMAEATPEWLPFLIANDAGEFRAQVREVVADAGRIARKRRAAASQIKRTLVEATDGQVSSGVELEDLLGEIDETRSRLQKTLNEFVSKWKPSVQKVERSFRSRDRAHAKDSDLLLKRFSQFKKFVNRDIAARQDLIELLSILSWDLDPSARGGPAFDNAEDLLADLRSDDE